MQIKRFVVESPWLVIFLCLLPVITCFTFLPKLVKDVRADAFLADDNPALIYKKKVKAEFGLSDPLVVAIVDRSSSGVFNKPTLNLVQSLTDQIADLPNINASKVVSLATEKSISATSDGMEIEPFFTLATESDDDLRAMRKSVMDFPLYVGGIVAADGVVTLIVAEMIDEDLAGESYRNFLAIVKSASLPVGVEVYVAGEGAIIGSLGEYVDADARQLMPFCGLVIVLILIIAFRGVLPALFAVSIVVATLSVTIGTMAAVGVPFYVITNALPVVLIGIAVADSIHIYMHYFDLQLESPQREVKSLVLETLDAMWRPITLTSLTTMAGFLGLYFAAYMPPFKYFGLFSAMGVMVAWFYSVFFLPAVMVLTKPQVSKKYAQQRRENRLTVPGLVLSAVGSVTMRHARTVIFLFMGIALWGAYTASHLVVDENALKVFHPDEAVPRADRVINKHLNGTNILDIVIETNEIEGLLNPANLQKMESLQTYASTLPYVGGSSSIVDYLKQMNKAVNDGRADEYRLPNSRETVAQYFLIYSATSDPTDFEEEVDYDYQTANIRVNIKSGDYQHVKVIVEALNDYIDNNVNSDSIKATLTGRVNLHYSWIRDLARSHFVGLMIAVCLVWVASSLLFRSALAGVLTLLPVACSVLLVYAVMGAAAIPLGMGSSMFAAVAVGLGIDYSIHTLERMRALYNETGQNMEATFTAFYPTTGKALLFNFMAIAGGFGVLVISKISSLNLFGAIVVLAVCSSFIASMTLLPALLSVFVPSFLHTPLKRSASAAKLNAGLLAIVVIGAVMYNPVAEAGDQPLELTPSADEIVDLINAVPQGDFVSRQVEMVMTDRRGKQRIRKTASFRKSYEGYKRTVIFFIEPANVRDTGFLIWDYQDTTKDDDQWLYLPALRKVRRISSADRGDYFLGTDFTYEDMKLDGKLAPQDYNFSLVGVEVVDGIESYKLEATPRDETLAKELGYSRTLTWVNPENWMILRAQFWDVKGQPLKTLTVSDVRLVGGIWTRHNLQFENHQTGHKTEFVISDVDYATEVPDGRLTKMALERGL